MFQVCPVCKGLGKIDGFIANKDPVTCDVCQGTKIINDLTGLPPIKEKATEPYVVKRELPTIIEFLK